MRELHYCVKELHKASRRLRVLSKAPTGICYTTNNKGETWEN